MKKIKTMIWLYLGIGFTVIGFICTGIGTIIQNNSSEKTSSRMLAQSDTIIALNEENKKLAIQAGEKALEFHKETKSLNEKNASLSAELLKKTEEYNFELIKPSVNVLTYRVVGNNDIAAIELTVKNTGGSDVEHIALIIDSHTSPLKGLFSIEGFELLPKSADVRFKIPLFRDNRFSNLPIGDDLQKKYEKFISEFKSGKQQILIKYHFEYSWRGNKYYTPAKGIWQSIGSHPIMF